MNADAPRSRTRKQVTARARALLTRAWRKAEEAFDAVFAARWGSALRRDARDQSDTLRALVLLEALGVDNPVGYETLELIPYVVADIHDWHRRMGHEELGEPGVCC
ncbi:cory-CC-star protein [Haloechinothrix aidingensis]|uniref:cory-CC-star protein n=1 Tax=Haloechinothrix aidingensis TaxID=2752311 RepID=UPI001FECB4D3|nr:cory-CC-star protein [Haloechinothrix aidingensis]